MWRLGRMRRTSQLEHLRSARFYVLAGIFVAKARLVIQTGGPFFTLSAGCYIRARLVVYCQGALSFRFVVLLSRIPIYSLQVVGFVFALE